MKPHVPAVPRIVFLLLAGALCIPATAAGRDAASAAMLWSGDEKPAPPGNVTSNASSSSSVEKKLSKDAPEKAAAAKDAAKAAEKEKSPSGEKETSAQGPVGAGGQRNPPGAAGSVTPARQPGAEPGQMLIELRYNVDGTQIQGNKERSFLNEGINHTQETNYLWSHPVRSTWKLESAGAYRYTDNPRVDPERNSMQRIYFRLSGPTFEGNLGDFLVNYSRFTFNQNVKGLHYWREFGRNYKLTVTGGYFADRWGSLYRPFSAFRNVKVDCQADSIPGNTMTMTPSAPASGCVETFPFSGIFVLDPNSPSKPYSRLVAGARFERKILRNGWLAANWSHGDDLLQSLPHARVTCDNAGVLRVGSIYPGCNLAGETEVAGGRRPATEAVLNDVFSLDSFVEFERLRLRLSGEAAFAWTAGGQPPAGATPTNFVCSAIAPVVGADVLDSRCFSDRVYDSALRFDAAQRWRKFNWRVDYSRFGPNFLSANARQIRDLQDINIRGDWEWFRQVTLAASFRRTNDNLNGKRSFTNLVRAPEVKLIFRELPVYRRLNLEVGYRERNLDQDGAPLPNEQRKRSQRIPFLSMTAPVLSTIFSFDYEHRRDSDAVIPQQSTDTDRWAFGMRGSYTWSGWDVSPALRFEAERLNKNSPNDPVRPLTDPLLVFPIDFFTAWDTNRSLQASLLVEAPKYFRFEGQYREFNSVTLSPVDPANPLITLLYLNQGFKRPSWRAALTYKWANDENKLITAFFERTNNFFATGDPALPDTKSFRETVIGGTILLRFRR